MCVCVGGGGGGGGGGSENIFVRGRGYKDYYTIMAPILNCIFLWGFNRTIAKCFRGLKAKVQDGILLMVFIYFKEPICGVCVLYILVINSRC